MTQMTVFPTLTLSIPFLLNTDKENGHFSHFNFCQKANLIYLAPPFFIYLFWGLGALCGCKKTNLQKTEVDLDDEY